MFRRNAFDDFARRHPALEHDLLERTLEELDRVREWMVLLGTMSASERLVTFLKTLGSRLGAPVAGQPGSIHISLPFGRQEIADILSLTIETVSRQITSLRIAGIIDTPDRRTVVLHNRTRRPGGLPE
jgi:CRP/FNR family transcriptional regulator